MNLLPSLVTAVLLQLVAGEDAVPVLPCVVPVEVLGIRSLRVRIP